MLRDQLKEKEYFDAVIDSRLAANKTWVEKCDTGQVKPDRIPYVKRNLSWTYLTVIQAKYSNNHAVEDLLDDWQNGVKLIHESWDGFWKLKQGNPPVEYDQYILSAYDEMLWMLSLGYLLGAPNEEFRKLVAVIDSDNVKDRLYEFIISAKLEVRQPIQKESYLDVFFIPEIFSTLRDAIQEPDQVKASSLVKDFLKKDWYKGHKDAGWYNSHKGKHDTYSGYWCFEAAAVTCILGLDDSSYRDVQYYPKDLVDHYRQNR
jgi:hypothetical protein